MGIDETMAYLMAWWIYRTPTDAQGHSCRFTPQD